jgi:hypothetical protein
MEPERKYPYTIYFWRVPDCRRPGKMRVTRHRMSEEEARSRHQVCERIEAGSMVIEGERRPHGSPWDWEK